jgi:hypothetical protein
MRKICHCEEPLVETLCVETEATTLPGQVCAPLRSLHDLLSKSR